MKSRVIATCLGLLMASGLMAGVANARQFVCTASLTYSSEPDGKLKAREDRTSSTRRVFTVDTATGVVQGDQVLPLGSYTVVYGGTSADGAKLIRNEAARLEVLFVATTAKNPYPFLFTDGVTTITGTCRPSS